MKRIGYIQGERVVGIPTGSLDDLAVTEAKLANLAVATGKIQLLAVDTAQLANLAVEGGKIALLAVDTGQLADLAVEAAKIGALAVETAKIDDLAVEEGKLANDAVTPAKLDPAVDYWQLQRATGLLLNLINQNDIAWTDMDLDTQMAALGLAVPAGAVGVIMEVYVVDTGAARPTMHTRTNGEVDADQENRVSAQVAGVALECMVIVEMDAGNIIEYWLQSTAGGATGAFWFKLLGWVMSP